MGFKKPDSKLFGGGIQDTDNFPGKTININELKTDLKKVIKIISKYQHKDSGAAFYNREKKNFSSMGVNWS